MTTNFDRLMENALREAGVEPTVIRSDDDLLGAVPLVHSDCFLVKLNGDYLDTRIKNTEQELNSFSPEMDNLLNRILDDHGLIVCGWSGDWDSALCAAITRAPNRRFTTFWALRGPASLKAGDLIKQRKAKTIPITDADSFFTALQQKIAAQADSQRPDPRSIEMLVAATKRYLGRPEFRIQLNDTLAEESRRLVGQLGQANFPREGTTTSPDEYRQRVARYEAAAEPLARMFGIIGRWGDESADRLVRDLLGSLAALKTEGGLVLWLDLRFYPTILLLYAYCLGALHAGRYVALFRCLANPIHNGKSVPIVRFLGTPEPWIGGRCWKGLKGIRRR